MEKKPGLFSGDWVMIVITIGVTGPKSILCLLPRIYGPFVYQ